jgi:hypothetical protein
MQPASRYWFPAKRYGWGWGVPATWQGWAVFIAYLGLLALGATFFPPRAMLIAFIAYAVILTVALLTVCWLKGEPPRWRWGNKD